MITQDLDPKDVQEILSYIPEVLVNIILEYYLTIIILENSDLDHPVNAFITHVEFIEDCARRRDAVIYYS